MRIVLVFLCACGSDPCAGTEEPALEIGGAGDDGGAFEAFSGGADRDLVYGTQGGYHVWLQVRMRGLCPDTTIFERSAIDETGAVRVYTRGMVPFVETDDGFELPSADRVILCPPNDGPVVDRPLLLRASVFDDTGRRAEAEISLVPRCRDADCPTICAP